jgi:hypothetical protein
MCKQAKNTITEFWHKHINNVTACSQAGALLSSQNALTHADYHAVHTSSLAMLQDFLTQANQQYYSMRAHNHTSIIRACAHTTTLASNKAHEVQENQSKREEGQMNASC